MLKCLATDDFHVATFCRLVEQDVFAKLPVCNKTKVHSNLGPQEKNALVDLQKDTNIVIKSADRGSSSCTEQSHIGKKYSDN